MAIAKALGLKASARTKKSDIIDQILETTGSPTARAIGAPVVPATALEDSSGNGDVPAVETPPADVVETTVVTAGVEPPAEWELDLGSGDDRPASPDAAEASGTSDTDRRCRR